MAKSSLGKFLLQAFALLCIAVVGASIIRQSIDHTSSASFGMDESDYTFAARQGWLASYLDHPSIGFPEFVRFGAQHGINSASFGALSDLIRESQDVTFYRHYHGPLFYYALSAAQSAGIRSEKGLRLFSWGVGLLAGLAMVFAYWEMSRRRSRFVAVVLASFPLFSPTLFMACANITPHVLFLSVACMALGAFSWFLRHPKRFHWYMTCAFCAIALITFEYTPMLIAAILCGALSYRKEFELAFGAHAYLKALASFLAVQLAVFPCLWIGGLAKLTIVKNYLFFGYFVLTRKGAFGDSSFLDVWRMRLSESPIEWLVAAAIVILGILQWRQRPQWRHHIAFVVLIVLATLRNRWPYPQYVVAMMPSVFVLLAVILESAARKDAQAKVAIVLASALMIANAEHFFKATFPISQQKVNYPFSSGTAMQRAIRSTHASSLYVQNYYAAGFHSYFPDIRVTQLRISDGHIENAKLARLLPLDSSKSIGIVLVPELMRLALPAVDTARYTAQIVRLDAASASAPICLSLKRR
jgi:hypothetical protein